MRALVTGGAGFIGSHLVDALLDKGFEVTTLDNFDNYYSPTTKRANLAHLRSNKNFRFVEGSILDKAILKSLVPDQDYIFHLAAQAGVGLSVKDPQKYLDINVTGTLNLLQSSIDSNVKKFIFASSSSVYGRSRPLPFKEDNTLLPVSPYGVTKLAAEHFCRVFNELYGLKTTRLRYFTVYGPRMRPDLAISIFVKKALGGEPITIFGTGDRTRDFTYVSDIVEANLLAIKKGDGCEFNIGGGSRITILDLAKKIIEITNSKSKIVFDKPREGDAEHTWADVSKAKRLLGWEPKVIVDAGLKKYISSINVG